MLCTEIQNKDRPYYIDFLAPTFRFQLIDRFFDNSGRLKEDILPHVLSLEKIEFKGSKKKDFRWQLTLRLDDELGDWLRKLFLTDAYDSAFPVNVHGGKGGDQVSEDVIDSFKLLIGGTEVQDIHLDFQARKFKMKERIELADAVLERSLSMELAASRDHTCHLAIATDRDPLSTIEASVYREVVSRFHEKEGSSVVSMPDKPYDIFQGTGLVWHGAVRHAGYFVPKKLTPIVDCVMRQIQWKDEYTEDDKKKLCGIENLNCISRFFFTTFPKELCNSRSQYLTVGKK